MGSTGYKYYNAYVVITNVLAQNRHIISSWPGFFITLCTRMCIKVATIFTNLSVVGSAE